MNDSRALVSIIVPVFNSERWVAETLNSALNQTWLNIEVIVVDDGSTDRSVALAQTFESRRLKLLPAEHEGAAAARNRGLRIAQGDFIQYLDSDDLLAKDKIERQFAVLQNDTKAIAGCSWARFHGDISSAQPRPDCLWADLSPTEFLIRHLNSGAMMPNFAWLVPRAVADKAGAWNEKLSVNDDGEYFCRCILASDQIRFIYEAVGYYRSGFPSSLSGDTSRAAAESQLKACGLIVSHLRRRGDTVAARKAGATALQRLVYELYPSHPDLIRRAKHAIQELGGSDLQPTGGLLFHSLQPLIGWKNARRMQKIAYKLGYGRLGLGRWLTANKPFRP